MKFKTQLSVQYFLSLASVTLLNFFLLLDFIHCLELIHTMFLMASKTTLLN